MMKKTLVIHPFLFAIYFVLFLYAHNTGQFPLSVIFIPAIITTCLVLLLCFLLSFILKDKKKAGLLVSLFVLLFFTYGHFYDAMKNTFFEWYIGRNTALLTVSGILFLLGGYFSIKTRSKLDNFTKLLNIVAASLGAISLISIGTHEFKTKFAWQDSRGMEKVGTNPIDLEKPAILPNIYYIILDGYARADILKELYNYDNAEFLDYLTQKGFYIANKSRTNYSMTSLSMASSLNFDYINGLFDQIDIEAKSAGPLKKIINNNSVSHFLKQYGYRFVTFSSGYDIVEIRNADIYMNAGVYLDEFQQGLINTTLIGILTKKTISYDLYRKKILYTFDHLADTLELESPIFVYAHISAPHFPFVFGAHGEEINPQKDFTWRVRDEDRDKYVESYRNEIIFVNKKVKTVLNEILSKSTNPPIIILQSDHGPGSMLDRWNPNNTNFKERLSILNAYYFPNNDHTYLYDEITPVNTFRVIFNRYFGTNYELLKDESYFSTASQPYKFINVTDKVNTDIDAEAVARKQ